MNAMKAIEATESIKADVRPGIRGVGCASIVMEDGRHYVLASEFGPPVVERFSEEGTLIERRAAEEIDGEVAHVYWSVDELGGIRGS